MAECLNCYLALVIINIHNIYMKEKLLEIKQNILAELERTKTLPQLEDIYNRYFGRNNGQLSQLVKDIKGVSEEMRPVLGQMINDVKKEVEDAYEIVKNNLAKKKDKKDDTHLDFFDITRPGVNIGLGSWHPISQIRNELNEAFNFLGFEIYDGPEISSEGYVFDNLNFSANHPARESMDTFWLNGSHDKKGLEKLCLRPHLTGESVRYMQTHKPPLRFVYPGRVFRSEATDAGHERCFYQYEALIVNKDISLAGGKILVRTILDKVFGREVKIRMRQGFFPFVEPGFEIDMECLNCGGSGCSVCQHKGWVEMMPGGPPHPNVLKAGHINPKKWQGFYINIGLDRLAMMKFRIDDIRLMQSGDIRFLRQF